MNYVKRDFGESSSLALGTLEPSSRQQRSWALPYRAVAPLAMAIDTLIIFAASILSGVAYHLQFVNTQGNIGQFAGFAAVVAALFISLAKSRDLYDLPELLNLKSQVRKIALKWTAVFVFLTTVAFAMKVGDSFSRGATITFAVSGLTALIGMRVFWRTFLADGLAVRRFSSRRIALIAEKSAAIDSGLLETLTRHGLQLAQHFVLPTERSETPLRKQVIADAIASVRGSNVEEIVISADLDHWPEITDLMSELRVLPLPVNLVPVGSLSELFKLSSHTIGDTVTIELQHGPRTPSQRFVKRVFDIALAGTALISFLPLLLVAAVAIKLDSPGPIIFRQWRRGFNGRPFQILKFRTMSVQEDGDHIIQAQPNDARVTRVGNLLRRTSIDELPQLFNVLQGNMSLVGPRPHAMAHDSQFDKVVGNYAYRHHVKPGVTGWAQVKGYRGETRTITDIEQRVKLDLWYIDNWTLATDIKILFMTVAEIARGKNAY
jgi:putative colanic acid biosynthesis UDP-glucose lipid carrier transferase